MTRPHSPAREGLILFAHGARDPRWALPFLAVAEQVRALRPDTEVRLAFLELMPPDLPSVGDELAQRGCVRITVVPLFLGAGGHVRRDLPALVAALAERHAHVDFRLADAVGEDPGVVSALAAAAAQPRMPSPDPGAHAESAP